MKIFLIALLIGIFFFSACGGTTPVSQPTLIPVVEQATSTPSPLTTAVPTSIPSITQTASMEPTEILKPVSCLPIPIQLVSPNGSHIGLQTPPELNGIKSIDTLLIQSGDDFSIGLNLMLTDQNQYLFWLEKFCDTHHGQRFTEVIDEITLPLLKDGEFATTTCQLADVPNSHVVATGYFREESTSSATYIKVIATQAWLINLDNWVFIEIPGEQLSNVSCTYEYN